MKKPGRSLGIGIVLLMAMILGNRAVKETEVIAEQRQCDEPEVVSDTPAETSGSPGKGAEKKSDQTVIVLDPGHGGIDEGCSRDGSEEKSINLEIARAVRAQLLEMGYEVILTRDTDTELTLEQRVNQTKEVCADLFVSIHQNFSEESEAEGIEVWYSGQNEDARSERLSKLILKSTVEGTKAKSRELQKTDALYTVRECGMPSCLIETGFLSNPSEGRKLADPEYQKQIASGIASGIDLFFHPKKMYLTFDDGPSVENTSAVLDILKERNIQATFFVVGENVKKHPEIARRIVEEGHTLGIHCNRHDYRVIYESVDSYVADFEEAHRIVQEVTGVDAKLFRFPGGSINAYNKKVYQDIINAMTERGYIYYDWNASLEDAVKEPKQEVLIENAVSSTLGRKKVVMLAHDVIHETTLCIGEIIDRFPEYEMLPLTEKIAPIQF